MVVYEREKSLYMQLADSLERDIRRTKHVNDKLASERELTQLYGVSRITVRQALQELERRGLVYKKHGKGTYVAAAPVSSLDLSAAYSFTEQMNSLGRHPQTQILSLEIKPVSEDLAASLQLEKGDQVVELERLRLADGIPLMLERSYLPAALFPGLTAASLCNRSLYEVLETEYAQTIRLAEEEFYASITLDREAAYLEIETGAAVLHLLRKTYNDKNRLIEYTLSIARADHFRYTIRHKRP